MLLPSDGKLLFTRRHETQEISRPKVYRASQNTARPPEMAGEPGPAVSADIIRSVDLMSTLIDLGGEGIEIKLRVWVQNRK